MWYFCLIVLIVFLIYRNSKLKKMHNKSINFCPRCGFNFNKSFKAIKSTNNIVNKTDFKDSNPKKSRYSDDEIKNTFILITGASLIILSAIIFLATTWYSTYNIVKIFVISLMLIVLFVASYVAKNILKLSQVAKAFYYMALIYIPIFLFSFSALGILGTYFSIGGNGRYIYLSLCCLIVFSIYAKISIKNKSFFITVFSIIFQCLFIIVTTLIFTNKISIILMNLIIYNILFNILFLNNKLLFFKNLSKSLCLIITCSLSLISLFFSITNITLVCFVDVLLMVLLLINSYILIVKLFNKEKLFDYLYSLLIMYTSFILLLCFDNFIIGQIVVSIAIASIFAFNILANKKYAIISYLESLTCYSVLIFMTIISSNVSKLSSSLLLIFISVLTLIALITTKNGKKILSYIFSSMLFITSLDIVLVFNLTILWLYLISIVLLTFALLFDDNSDLKVPFRMLSNIVFILVSIYILTNSVFNSSMLTFVFLILYVFLNFINGLEKTRNKIISYIFFNLALVIFCNVFHLDVYDYIVAFTTVGYLLIEYISNKFSNKACFVYILIQFIISFILLVTTSSIINAIIYISLCILYRFFINDNCNKDKLLFIPGIVIIPMIYLNQDIVINNISIANYVSIVLIAVYLFIYIKSKKNVYSVLFYIYTILNLIIFDKNDYASLILLLIGVIINYIYKNKKSLYEGLIYTIALFIGLKLISDFHLDFSVFKIGIYLIYITLISRRILNKKIKSYKALEYIFYCIINFIALLNYKNDADGFIYIGFMAMLLMIGYTYKLGPLFFTSIGFIVLNVFIYTSSFWFSLPWWLYLLMIGVVLIIFAANNEAKKGK